MTRHHDFNPDRNPNTNANHPKHANPNHTNPNHPTVAALTLITLTVTTLTLITLTLTLKATANIDINALPGVTKSATTGYELGLRAVNRHIPRVMSWFMSFVAPVVSRRFHVY